MFKVYATAVIALERRKAEVQKQIEVGKEIGIDSGYWHETMKELTVAIEIIENNVDIFKNK